MSNKYEQRFFSALKDTLVVHKIKGKSGYVNLLDLKQQTIGNNLKDRLRMHIYRRTYENKNYNFSTICNTII